MQVCPHLDEAKDDQTFCPRIEAEAEERIEGGEQTHLYDIHIFIYVYTCVCMYR